MADALRMGDARVRSAAAEELSKLMAETTLGMVAAKLEAFSKRGQRELPVSDDLEDIIARLDGRRAIEHGITDADPKTRAYISRGMDKLLNDGAVRDVITDSSRDRAREQRMVELMRRLMAR